MGGNQSSTGGDLGKEARAKEAEIRGQILAHGLTPTSVGQYAHLAMPRDVLLLTLASRPISTERLPLGRRSRYQVRVDIAIDDATSGTVYVDVHPTWSPRGEARFRELLLAGWFDGCRFFRVIPGFMVQFGLAAEPAKLKGKVDTSNIKDDPVLAGNSRGRIVRCHWGRLSLCCRPCMDAFDGPSG